MLTSEYKNIGQWNCYEMWHHPLTGAEYKIPADHGILRERPLWVLSYEKARCLPRMREGAVKVHRMQNKTGGQFTYYVEISRKKKETNIYRREFVNMY